MLKSSTLLFAATLALLISGRAAAQTELNSVPQPGRTGPATAPAPTPYAPATLTTADPAPRYRSSLSLELGWGAPYGFGLTYGRQLTPNFDVNAGLGIGVGAKIGVGTRYYFNPQRALTPYIGANLVRTGRLDQVSVDLNGEQAVYSMRPSGVLHLRGGLRWQPGRVGLLGTLGYGARFTGNPVSYDPGYNPSQQLRDLVQVISPGGVEFSVGLVIGLGR